MRSKAQSIRIPSCLTDQLEARAAALGYPSVSAYFLGLARYDFLVQGPHALTVPWSHLSIQKQDAIDDNLSKLLDDGKGQRGQLLTRLIERASNPDSAGIAAAMETLNPDKTKP